MNEQEIALSLLIPRKVEQKLEIARKALKRECSCSGHFDYDGKPILCDACEALEKIK